MVVLINGNAYLVLSIPPPSPNYVIESTEIVIHHIFPEVTVIAGSAVSPELQTNVFLNFPIAYLQMQNKK